MFVEDLSTEEESPTRVPTDTGKSTFLNLIRFLGEENVSDVALQDLETNRFQLVNLVGKLANIYADIDKKELAQSRRFKTTTGGDRVTVERKFMQSFETYIYAKDLLRRGTGLVQSYPGIDRLCSSCLGRQSSSLKSE